MPLPFAQNQPKHTPDYKVYLELEPSYYESSSWNAVSARPFQGTTAPWGKDWEISSSERVEHQNEPLVFPENATKATITSKATTFIALTPSPTLKISLMPFFSLLVVLTINMLLTCHLTCHGVHLVWSIKRESLLLPCSVLFQRWSVSWCDGGASGSRRGGSWERCWAWGPPSPQDCWEILASYHFINLPFTNIFKNGIDCLQFLFYRPRESINPDHVSRLLLCFHDWNSCWF